MTNLTDFLLARIDDDEAAARAAGEQFGGSPWVFDGDAYVTGQPPFDGAVRGHVQDPRIGRHVARHDPARVLSECESKRRVVAGLDYASRYGIDGADQPELNAPYYLRLLALPYADHPEWREEWKP